MSDKEEVIWRKIYKTHTGIATVMSPDWLKNGCPICQCKNWQVTGDCWAYCKGCKEGMPTKYPFTKESELITDL